jgi:hypothetical protein
MQRKLEASEARSRADGELSSLLSEVKRAQVRQAGP